MKAENKHFEITKQFIQAVKGQKLDSGGFPDLIQ